MNIPARSVVGPVLAFLLAAPPSSAQQGTDSEEADRESPHIVGPVADGTPPPPSPPADLPFFRVEATLLKRLADRNAAVHRVADPKLPPLPKPPPPVELTAAEIQELQELFAQARKEAPRMCLVFVSATVYRHEKTFLRWWVTGDGKPPEEFNGWSNVDWNHLCGFASYQLGGVEYGLMMGIGNTAADPDWSLNHDEATDESQPRCPELPADRPAYVITKGDVANQEGVALIQGLHDLYQNERERLIAAYQGRERARLEREAYLKEHPPKPKDVILYYWRGKRTTIEGQGGAR